MTTQIYAYIAGKLEAALSSLPADLHAEGLIDQHLKNTLTERVGHTIHTIKNDQWLMHVLHCTLKDNK